MHGSECPTGLRMQHWGLALLALIAFKQGYGMAGAEQLQWMLRPLVLLLEAVSTLSFQPLPGGDWLDAECQVILVKACAGGNFLLVSWLAYLWRWRQGAPAWRVVLAAGAAAWLTTLAANALRILLLVYGQDDLSRLLGLSAPDSHRLIGIGVYFFCLWTQLSRPGRASSALLVAAVLYLGVNLLLPAIRAGVLGLGPLDRNHIVWTAGFPVGLMLSWGVARFAWCRLTRNRPGTGSYREIVVTSANVDGGCASARRAA